MYNDVLFLCGGCAENSCEVQTLNLDPSRHSFDYPSLIHPPSSFISNSSPNHQSLPETSSSLPSQLSVFGSSVVESQGVIFSFGGQRVSFDQELTNTLYTLDLEKMEWREQPTSGDIPPPIAWHTGQIWDNKMFIFGGMSLQAGETVPTNDLFVLDLESLVWRFVKTEGSQPSPRYLHTAVVENGTMWVFGGMNQHRLNDLFALDIATLTWTFLTPGKNQPPPICSHVAVYSPVSRSMLVFGGRTSERAENKLWAYSFSQHSWSVVTTESSPPQPRYFHSACTQFIPSALQAISFTAFPLSIPAVTGNLYTPYMSSEFHPVPPAAVPKVASIDVGTPMVRFVISGGIAYDHSFLSDVWILEEIADPKTNIPTTVNDTVAQLIKQLDAQEKFLQEGIFRISPPKATIDELRGKYQKKRDLELYKQQPHVLSGFLKTILREFLQPFVPVSQSPLFTAALSTLCPPHAMRLLISTLPAQKRDIMHSMCSFLGKVSLYHEQTKMSIKNFSIVFTPIFFEEFNQQMTTLANLSMIQPNNPLFACTEVLIAQHEVCFSGVSKRLFCPYIAVAEALYGSEGSAGTFMKELGFEAGEVCFCYAFDWPGEGWMLGEVKGEVGMLPMNYFRMTRMGEEKKREEERKGEKERKRKDEKKEEVVQPTLSILPSDRTPDKTRLRKCWPECVWEAVFQETKKDAVAVCLQSREEDEVGEEGEQAPLLQCDLPNCLHSVDSAKGRNEGVRNKGRGGIGESADGVSCSAS
ncbi:putative Actin-fragmin kinase [Blattamonas nauphoetae]|uniref:Actin-fragmin kinase n=1 Tax=Blattamonas nauphoetae TaxID=2049346 RepID=A0ABQ9YDI2_9EUKA|nr:putative Actin-fragmin kinase [Blattamonas nauphoetae]